MAGAALCSGTVGFWSLEMGELAELRGGRDDSVITVSSSVSVLVLLALVLDGSYGEMEQQDVDRRGKVSARNDTVPRRIRARQAVPVGWVSGGIVQEGWYPPGDNELAPSCRVARWLGWECPNVGSRVWFEPGVDACNVNPECHR
jgi:hypothetical protein